MAETKKLIPKRRFKEFQNAEEWECSKLTDEVELFSGLTYSPNNIVRDNGTFVLRSSNVKNGEVVDADNVYVNSEVVNSCNVKQGDIIVVVRNGSRSLIGKHAQIKREMDKTVIGAFMTGLRPEHSNFINALLDTPVFKNEIDKNLGATINQITNGMLQQMKFLIPKPEEQDMIGNFFEGLDNLITLQQHKLEKIKAMKKAYLYEMFPAEGESKPKRRFKEFQNAGEWEQRKLNEMCFLITKGTTPLDKSGEGEVNFIKVENIDSSSGKINIVNRITFEEHNGYLKRSQLKKDDILFSIAGTLGRITTVFVNVLPANTNQALAIIRLKENNLDYIKTFLKSKSVTDYIKKNPTIGAQPNLSLEQVGNLVIDIPSIDEQTKLGDFFAKLDNLITLHQSKLDKLKNLKKAYLNEMFI